MDYSKIHFQFETPLKLLWLDLDNESVVVVTVGGRGASTTFRFGRAGTVIHCATKRLEYQVNRLGTRIALYSGFFVVISQFVTVVSGGADYTLWHGRAFDMQETNLLVVEAKKAKGNGCEQCLAYMAMLLYSRRDTGRSARTIWGINTDSNDWEFIRLNPDLTYSTRKSSVEEGQFKDIITTLARISADSAVLSPMVSLASNEESRKRSFEDAGK